MHDFLTVCDKAARAAGDILLAWQDKFTAREKGRHDLVTEADVAAQKEIRQILLGAFPDHDFLGEEDAPAAETAEKSRSPFRWIVDPLDGTANYVHHLPAYAVSIALEKSGEIVLGVVFDPNARELFHAIRGEGVFLNGKRIQVSGCTQAERAMVAVSFAPNVPRGSIEISRFIEALHACQSVRRLGSAALNLAYVAAGRLDSYWASSVKIWDIAAGVLLVQEAGGVITAISGAPLDLARPEFLASASQPLHSELLGVIAGAK